MLYQIFSFVFLINQASKPQGSIAGTGGIGCYVYQWNWSQVHIESPQLDKHEPGVTNRKRCPNRTQTVSPKEVHFANNTVQKS